MAACSLVAVGAIKTPSTHSSHRPRRIGHPEAVIRRAEHRPAVPDPTGPFAYTNRSQRRSRSIALGPRQADHLSSFNDSKNFDRFALTKASWLGRHSAVRITAREPSSVAPARFVPLDAGWRLVDCVGTSFAPPAKTKIRQCRGLPTASVSRTTSSLAACKQQIGKQGQDCRLPPRCLRMDKAGSALIRLAHRCVGAVAQSKVGAYTQPMRARWKGRRSPDL